MLGVLTLKSDLGLCQKIFYDKRELKDGKGYFCKKYFLGL